MNPAEQDGHQPACADASALWRIRVIHSVIWAVFAGAIMALPVAVAAGAWALAWGLSALVWVEVAVLIVNGMRCPLTAIAARHTTDREANFDIFLPLWLARHNKLVFGSLFALGEGFLLWRWLHA